MDGWTGRWSVGGKVERVLQSAVQYGICYSNQKHSKIHVQILYVHKNLTNTKAQSKAPPTPSNSQELPSHPSIHAPISLPCGTTVPHLTKYHRPITSPPQPQPRSFGTVEPPPLPPGRSRGRYSVRPKNTMKVRAPVNVSSSPLPLPLATNLPTYLPAYLPD